jgi:excisionase family DNA binding protein
MDLADSLEKTGVLTVSGVASLLKIRERQVYKLGADGRIPSFKIGNSIRFDPVHSQPWLRQKIAPAPADTQSQAGPDTLNLTSKRPKSHPAFVSSPQKEDLPRSQWALPTRKVRREGNSYVVTLLIAMNARVCDEDFRTSWGLPCWLRIEGSSLPSHKIDGGGKIIRM